MPSWTATEDSKDLKLKRSTHKKKKTEKFNGSKMRLWMQDAIKLNYPWNNMLQGNQHQLLAL